MGVQVNLLLLSRTSQSSGFSSWLLLTILPLKASLSRIQTPMSSSGSKRNIRTQGHGVTSVQGFLWCLNGSKSKAKSKHPVWICVREKFQRVLQWGKRKLMTRSKLFFLTIFSSDIIVFLLNGLIDKFCIYIIIVLS